MKSFSLNIRGQIRAFTRPQVMGILNVTPDSFFDGSRTLGNPDPAADMIKETAARMISEGADMIDVGGYSTRPGADEVSPDEELRRVRLGIAAVRELSSDIILSVDTWRSEVARVAVTECGCDIVNDISAGTLDPEMIPTVASLKVPYIMMHTRGTPATMDALTGYPDGVVAGVASELRARIVEATLAGIADIIVDPGFGFAKTVEENYALLAGLSELSQLLDSRPMLVGVSRKSMLYRPLGLTPADVLPATTAVNTLALERGAAILRVHDVIPCHQALAVTSLLSNNQ
ncbi:MAG: dihydropteroate synthase [Muribaculaceae bacterium]|nr:dihydropteroate synthase [Muribaculaceae bacterium]